MSVPGQPTAWIFRESTPPEVEIDLDCKQVAALLGRSAGTIRSWCAAYGPLGKVAGKHLPDCVPSIPVMHIHQPSDPGASEEQCPRCRDSPILANHSQDGGSRDVMKKRDQSGQIHLANNRAGNEQAIRLPTSGLASRRKA